MNTLQQLTSYVRILLWLFQFLDNFNPNNEIILRMNLYWILRRLERRRERYGAANATFHWSFQGSFRAVAQSWKNSSLACSTGPGEGISEQIIEFAHHRETRPNQKTRATPLMSLKNETTWSDIKEKKPTNLKRKPQPSNNKNDNKNNNKKKIQCQ